MQFPLAMRDSVKRLVALSKVKILYSRITLTRTTCIYFFVALLHCIVVVSLETVIFHDNKEAGSFTTEIVTSASVHHTKFPVVENGVLMICDTITGDRNGACVDVRTISSPAQPQPEVEVSTEVPAEPEAESNPGPGSESDSESDSDSDSDSDSEDDSDDEDAVATRSLRRDMQSIRARRRAMIQKRAARALSKVSRAPAPVPQASPAPPDFTASGLLQGLRAKESDSSVTVTFSPPTHSMYKRTGSVTPSFVNGTAAGVSVVDGTEVISLDMQCVTAFIFIDEIFHDDKRENLVTIAFCIWVFGLSVLAILNESIPHLASALAAQILTTAWSGYQLKHADDLWDLYSRFVVDTHCNGVDLLSGWWMERMQHTLPVVILNAITTVGLCVLSFFLFRTYSQQSFTRVGGSPQVLRVYKLVLLVSVLLQLACFFSFASAVLWADKIANSAVSNFATHKDIYLVTSILIAIVTIPWVIIGWISIRKEKRILFLVFVVIGLLLIVAAAAMFASSMYRFVFNSWAFFAAITFTSFLLTVAATTLGVVCRIVGFGKGLSHFLHVQDVLEGADFAPVYFTHNDMEKNAGGDRRVNSTSSESYWSAIDDENYLKSRASLTKGPITVMQLPSATERAEEKRKSKAFSVLSLGSSFHKARKAPGSLFGGAKSVASSRLSSGSSLSAGTAAPVVVIPPLPAARVMPERGSRVMPERSSPTGRGSPTRTHVVGLPANPRPGGGVGRSPSMGSNV